MSRPARPLGALAAALLLCGCAPSTTPPATVAALGPGEMAALSAACVRASACARASDPPWVRSVAECLDTMVPRASGRLRAWQQCVGSATGCDAIARCSGSHGDSSAAAFCATHPGAQTACDGATLYSCADDELSASSARDCAALGGRCAQHHAPGGIVASACLSPQLCPTSAPRVRCEGGSVVHCEDGAVEKTPCAAGTTCKVQRGVDGEPMAICEGAHEARCERPGARFCREHVLVDCTMRGAVEEIECPAKGLRCAARGTTAACVDGDAPSCTSRSARCDGSDLVFCGYGRERRVDCRSLGFERCEPAARGPEAACARGAR